MRYYHITPRGHWPFIRNTGLFPQTSIHGRKVFLVTRRRVKWALRHGERRYRYSTANLVVLEIDLPRRWSMNGKLVPVLRQLGQGFWACSERIPAEKITMYHANDWMHRNGVTLFPRQRRACPPAGGATGKGGQQAQQLLVQSDDS
jgi:hypothetical protein